MPPKPPHNLNTTVDATLAAAHNQPGESTTTERRMAGVLNQKRADHLQAASRNEDDGSDAAGIAFMNFGVADDLL